MIPTADDVAIAIVTAARLTGEDPLLVADANAELQCRHYVVHALAAIFPLLPTKRLGFLVGLDEKKAIYFYRASRWSVLGYAPQSNRRDRAHWWSEGHFEAVTDALCKRVLPRQEMAAEIRSTEAKAKYEALAAEAMPNPVPPRKPVPREPMGRTVTLTPPPAAQKRSLHDMLAEAVRNTAKMTPPADD